jgi:cyclic pyranopterin phosphate synthase
MSNSVPSPSSEQSPLSHFDATGAVRMVDVSEKAASLRTAVASGVVRMKPETMHLILDRRIAKGDVLETARLAAVMAVKKTPELIPLCHAIPIDGVDVRFETSPAGVVRIEATVRATARTGVEMEALTAVSVAALTIYDMCKAVDRGIELGPFVLLEKLGGKSGLYRRDEHSPTTVVV